MVGVDKLEDIPTRMSKKWQYVLFI